MWLKVGGKHSQIPDADLVACGKLFNLAARLRQS
jgi:hypothetical protein